MNAVTTRTAMFPSRLHEWSRARGFIEEFCAAAAVPRQACLRANLVVEELFMNTVKHGHAGGSDLPVWLTLAAQAGRIGLTYEDFAPPFNPFAPERREGGLGVILAQGIAAKVEYAYLFGRNRIRLAIG